MRCGFRVKPVQERDLKVETPVASAAASPSFSSGSKGGLKGAVRRSIGGHIRLDMGANIVAGLLELRV